MIKLTHLGGEEFVLNADLICYVETRPDTFVTLSTGDRVVVRETLDDVLRRAIDYQRSKHLVPMVLQPIVRPEPDARAARQAAPTGHHH